MYNIFNLIMFIIVLGLWVNIGRCVYMSHKTDNDKYFIHGIISYGVSMGITIMMQIITGCYQ